MYIRVITRMLLVGALASMVACVPSLNALYTSDDLVLEPALLGTWGDDGSEESWTLSQADNNTYRLVHKDDQGNEGIFVVGLVKIQDHLVFDMSPAEPDCLKDDVQKGFLFPMHMFGWVQQIEPELKIAVLKPDWIEEHIEANPNAIQHAEADDTVFLTAPAKELQTFVGGLFEIPEAWGELDPIQKIESAK